MHRTSGGARRRWLCGYRPGVDLTEDQVVAYARERLAKFKVPTSVEFVESLPMTATGKIQKNVLRDRVAQ